MNYFEQVYKTVSRVPKGKVTTYGQIAKMISTGSAARTVGWALRALPNGTKVPWQRVIGKGGIITIVNPQATKSLQAALLRRDGIKVVKDENQYIIDLYKYLWHPN